MTYPNFNEVEDRKVRAWNRVTVSHNISVDSGEEKAKEYLSQFPPRDKVEMMGLIQMILKYGQEEVKKEIFKSVH